MAENKIFLIKVHVKNFFIGYKTLVRKPCVISGKSDTAKETFTGYDGHFCGCEDSETGL